MRDKGILYFFLLLLTAVFIGGLVNHCSKPSIPMSDTITITRYDTLYVTDTFLLEKPKPYKVEVIKRDTLYTKDTTEVVLETEKTLYQDTLCQENDTIFLEQLIQGINAKVLYTKALLKKQYIEKNSETIINNYIEKKKKPTIKITPQVGIGYGITHKQADIYIGVGASLAF